MNGRSHRGRWVLLLLGLALVVWVVAAPTWVRAGGTSALTGTVPVGVPGTRAAPGTVGAALALGAAGVALALAGRVGRWLVVTVVLACGALVLWSAAGVLRNPAPAARQAVAAATGVDHVVAPAVSTAWPWAAGVTGVVVMVVGLALARASARWDGPSRRHELPSPGVAQVAALEEVPTDSVQPGGEQPSGNPVLEPAPLSEGADPGVPGEVRRTRVGAEGDGSGRPQPDERAAWDALSRGEDPT